MLNQTAHQNKRAAFDEEAVSQCVHKLLIVSQIRERDRLRTNNTFSVDAADSHFQGLRRWMCSESRNMLLTSLEELFQKSTQLCRAVIQQRNLYDEDTVQYTSLRLKLEMLSGGMSRSVQGLVNLKTTYENDRNVCTRLEMLITGICNDLETLEKINKGQLRNEVLENLPVNTKNSFTTTGTNTTGTNTTGTISSTNTTSTTLSKLPLTEINQSNKD